jgi:hypothetical protein
MLYNTQELLGKVVTLKTIKGDEIITKLIGFDEETDTMTLEYPKIVVVAGDTVALVMESLPTTVTDYEELIADQKKAEEEA